VARGEPRAQLRAGKEISGQAESAGAWHGERQNDPKGRLSTRTSKAGELSGCNSLRPWLDRAEEVDARPPGTFLGSR